MATAVAATATAAAAARGSFPDPSSSHSQQRRRPRVCVLPSRKQGVRCGARCGPGAGGRGPAAAHERHARREGPNCVKAGEARSCAERTENM
eukprot:scaffold26259_cov55-Phaeocystis_antarctica.AAC.1